MKERREKKPAYMANSAPAPWRAIVILDIPHVLETLAKRRRVFHSEADFQYALAWEIHEAQPDAAIRLELPVRASDGRTVHVDLFVTCGHQRFAIELKYKTEELNVRDGAEHFSLRSHSAQDTGRYDFLADVARLERYVASEENVIGYALMLSNDRKYWKETRPNNISEQF